MSALLFLDLDGVLHTEYYDSWLSFSGKALTDEFGAKFSPSCIRNLNFIVKRTDAKIVLVSNWRHFGLQRMKEMWEKRSLPGIVIGMTPYLTDETGSELNRGEEIARWLQENEAANAAYVIIDDRSEEYTDRGKLVQVGYRRGLTFWAAKRVCRILKR